MDGIRSKRSSLKDGQINKDNFSLINAFDNIKKNWNETVTDFNARFSKAYYKIPTTIRPNVTFALIYYLEAYDGIFGMFLRSKDPQNLEEAQVVAIKLERNFLATYGFLPIHDFQPSVVTRVQEVLVIEDEPQLAPYQVPKMNRMVMAQS
jgi:hypothetical protein